MGTLAEADQTWPPGPPPTSCYTPWKNKSNVFSSTMNKVKTNQYCIGTGKMVRYFGPQSLAGAWGT